MAESITFTGHNRVFLPEAKVEDRPHRYPVMFGFSGGWFTFSRWRLTPEELAEVTRTGEIWVAIRTGNRSMQPTMVGSRTTIRHRGLDFGRIWNDRPRQLMIEDKSEEA